MSLIYKQQILGNVKYLEVLLCNSLHLTKYTFIYNVGILYLKDLSSIIILDLQTGLHM